MNISYISDKIIWITGASSGIGLSIVKMLSAYKSKLLLTSRNIDSLREATININGKSTNYLFPLDVSCNHSVNEAFEFIIQEVGYPDILINNAGVYSEKPFLDTSISDLNSIIANNFTGFFNTTQCVLPAMIEQKGGAIINILSVTAIESFPNCSIYSASKSAAFTMMKCLREEVRQHHIKVINILPGAVATNL